MGPLGDLTQDYSDKCGKDSQLILESFFKFILRIKKTRLRTGDQWTQIQDETGENAITQVLKWATHLSRKVVFTIN